MKDVHSPEDSKMVAIVTIGKTDLKYGYFFNLHNCRDIDLSGFPDVTNDWIVSPSPDGKDHGRGVVDRTKSRRVERFRCSKNPEHGISKELYDYEVDLINVELPLTPFVSEHDHVIVNEWLSDCLKGSELKGFRLLPTTVFANPMRYNATGKSAIGKLFQVTFDGRSADARYRIEPASANNCPFCGAGPLICPECGSCSGNSCAQCGKEWNVSERLHRGRHDRRIKLEEHGISSGVVDPRRWDGSDFMGESHGGQITRRALEWLLSIHAGPFVAQPIPVNVFELTSEELERLDMARRPIRDVQSTSLEAFMKKPPH